MAENCMGGRSRDVSREEGESGATFFSEPTAPRLSIAAKCKQPTRCSEQGETGHLGTTAGLAACRDGPARRSEDDAVDFHGGRVCSCVRKLSYYGFREKVQLEL